MKITMVGDKEAQNLFKQLPKRVASKGNKAAVTAAAKPMKPALKALAPRESGLTKKSIGTKIKTYRSDAGTIAAAIVGARVDTQGVYKGKTRKPAKYWHLHVKGTRQSPGDDIVAKAYNQTKSQAEAAGARKFEEVISKEIGKLSRK